MLAEQQQRILGYFIEEAKDHLNTIEQGLLNLQGTLDDSEMVNEVFRAAHSIKGGAAMLGLSSIQRTAHRLEDCFKVLKEQPVKVDQKLESLFLGVSDTLKALLEHLQGPFGLTEEAASTLMSETEPVFQWLNEHLQMLIEQSGGAIPKNAFTAPTPVVLVSEVPQINWNDFQNQVLQILREMLQLFKQPATTESRQNLQICCQQLACAGRKNNLSNWCNLCDVVNNAIANPENSFLTLAKVVITDIKKSLELAIAGKEDEITISQQLQAISIQIELLEISSDTPENTDAVVEDVSNIEPVDVPEEDLVHNLSELNIENNHDEESEIDLTNLDPHGPEVGIAELNTLADLFEGETPELDENWQQEQVVDSTPEKLTDSVSESTSEAYERDYTDLFLIDDEFANDPSKITNIGTSDLTILQLFGDDFIDEESDQHTSTTNITEIYDTETQEHIEEVTDLSKLTFPSEAIQIKVASPMQLTVNSISSLDELFLEDTPPSDEITQQDLDLLIPIDNSLDNFFEDTSDKITVSNLDELFDQDTLLPDEITKKELELIAPDNDLEIESFLPDFTEEISIPVEPKIDIFDTFSTGDSESPLVEDDLSNFWEQETEIKPRLDTRVELDVAKALEESLFAAAQTGELFAESPDHISPVDLELELDIDSPQEEQLDLIFPSTEEDDFFAEFTSESQDTVQQFPTDFHVEVDEQNNVQVPNERESEEEISTSQQNASLSYSGSKGALPPEALELTPEFTSNSVDDFNGSLEVLNQNIDLFSDDIQNPILVDTLDIDNTGLEINDSNDLSIDLVESPIDLIAEESIPILTPELDELSIDLVESPIDLIAEESIPILIPELDELSIESAESPIDLIVEESIPILTPELDESFNTELSLNEAVTVDTDEEPTDLTKLLANVEIDEISQPEFQENYADIPEEFAQLEALLESQPSPPQDDFADLEAMLGIDLDVPIPDANTNRLEEDFSDLEKLLGSDNTLASTGKSNNNKNRRTAKFEQTMRVPVKHLDDMSNLVGELVVNRNTLEEDQERQRQSLDNLLIQVQQLSDVGARMQELYERSLLEASLLASRNNREAFTPHPDTDRGFSELEMDRFTPFHTLSQEMIELIVRVRESASDIDFVTEETERVARQFRQVTTQLQEGLTRARMVPFAQVTDRLQRGARDNAIKSGKQVELVIEGRDTLIDKMILEHLTDPLTHMLNNAIAHGIETPEVRSAAGKLPVGTITLRAFHQGNQTIISVSDDGAGINSDKVKAKALKIGMISQEQAKAMSPLDVYDLLFQPGFSIKDQADELAGRGVGMDVVRSSISEIRGTINTDSKLNKGTTFTIRLPLTLSICKALCCVSDKARIAFPMDGVEDTLDIPLKNIQQDSEGHQFISWRDTKLPFKPLKELLTFNRQLSRGNVYGGNRDDDMVSVVVVRSASTFIALQIDQVLNEQEIVIKQFEGPAPKPIGVAGATVLGDGRIMPIADVLEIIDIFQGGRTSKSSVSILEQQKITSNPSDTAGTKIDPTVLIVDDSITVRELLSLTFNKAGYRVEQARDGQEAWDKLRSGLPCDIVFCDIEMPRCDGLELLSRIQKEPSLNHLPIAMLTSRGADKHRQMAVQLGASGYFTKPYLEEALLEAAGRMLKGEKLVISNG
jgi:chemosensory pili system protein ChpA (sensor histidine kinase/response regulator)